MARGTEGSGDDLVGVGTRSYVEARWEKSIANVSRMKIMVHSVLEMPGGELGRAREKKIGAKSLGKESQEKAGK